MLFGGLAQPLRPVRADQVVVPADSSGGDDHRLRPEVKLPDLGPRAGLAALDRVGFQDRSPDALDRARADGELVDPMAELQRDQAAGDRLSDPSLEGRHHAGAGAPRDVEARHGVPMSDGAVAATLRPAHDGKEPEALRPKPRPLLPGGEVDIRLGPLPRPVVFVAIEPGGTQPVLPRQLVRVVDPKAALLGRVDEEEAAERPERLPAQPRLGLLLQQDHPPLGFGQLRRGHQPGQARPHHDDVGVVTHGRTIEVSASGAHGGGRPVAPSPQRPRLNERVCIAVSIHFAASEQFPRRHHAGTAVGSQSCPMEPGKEGMLHDHRHR